MSDKELKDELDHPEIISHSIIMDEPNEHIPIHIGLFELRIDDVSIKLEGKIVFEWFPRAGTTFKGTIKETVGEYYKVINVFNTFQLYINNESIGNCLINNTALMSTGTEELEGCMVSTTIKGDKTIPVSKVKFSLPNFINFRGIPVKVKTEKSIKVTLNRIILKNDAYEIILDKRHDFDSMNKKLQSKGGYLILYHGEISKIKGSISYNDLEDIIYSLSTFLSFINGKRCSPLFLEGIHDNEVIWTDYSDRFIDQDKFVPTWPNKHTINGLNDLWQNFSILWKEEKHKNFLITAIHWYIEANSQSGFSEGSIIMAQTDLELIYNWLIIEKHKLLIGKDAENISASNKIRLILSHLKIDSAIPDSMPNLKSNIEFIDGPEAIVQIRNALVHGQEEKRRKLTLLDNKVKYQVLNLAIWYIELSLLFVLDHKGIYINRCNPAPFISSRSETVPWMASTVK